MGFILDGLDTENYDRQYTDGALVRRIGAYFQPHARAMTLAALLVVVHSAANAGGSIMIARGMDVLTTSYSESGLWLVTAGIFVVGVLGWGANFVRQRLSTRVLGAVVLRLREDVFDATLRHDLSFYDEQAAGKIVSRVTSDTQDFATVADLTMNLLSQVVVVLFLTGWLFVISPWLTLLLVGMTPLAVGIALSFRRIARRVTQESRRITATINAQIQESISGIVVAKSFRQEPAIYATFAANNELGYRIGLRRGLTLVTIFPIMGAATGLGTAMLAYLGGLSTRDGAVSPGNWYLFLQAVGFYWWPLMSIASFWSQFQDGLSAAERAFALMDAEPRVHQTAAEPIGRLAGDVETLQQDDLSKAERLTGIVEAATTMRQPARARERLAGAIEFRHVRFAYNRTEVVLQDFSVTIKPRELVALVGHTGAGKSSIAKLITRFYEFQGGELLVDGRDIRRFDLAAYRQQLGVVPQEPFLFTGTVRENIRYGRASASDAEVELAARHISAGEWLESLPRGLESSVGERGSSLSMGQRQLVALARVLLKDPTILILDEATASVDPFTETQIQEGLDTLLHGRTALVIAHRLSTVMHADRILVMDHGQIIEEGSHAALLASGGHYAGLYNTYFRHQSLAYIEALGAG